MENKGIFITIEGTDGCGKGTQVAKLKEFFAGRDDVVFTREPGGGYISEQIRTLLLDNKVHNMNDMTEFLLFSASRVQFLYDTVIPALNAGKIVFCERFYDSSLAYQGYGRGLDIGDILVVSKIATRGIEPDYTLFFDLPIGKEIEKRMRQGGLDRIEQEGINFQKKVYNGYKKIAKLFEERYITIDATGTKDEVFKNVKNALKEKGII